MSLKIEDLDLSKQMATKEDYKQKLKELQLGLLSWQRPILETKSNIILIFEGPDAAGKGGVIKRFAERMDPRLIRVWSVIKPTEEEYNHHYLWRFWTKVPTFGQIAIFDRSWYGRVLVERIEGFCSEPEWKRAYEEINHFEKTLSDAGSLILKFYIHVSKKEQLRRFKSRAEDPYKHWKINEEDWRNRRKWEQYIEAADDMFKQTHTKSAPWHLIEGEFKWHSRVKTLKIILQAIEKKYGKKK
ncbi:MAG: UDP-galactose-lipid carrier transferase [Verrucomicrobiota bacterium]|nr:UDP-galactose-lipid carrier transferase [Verrucomicrobiota bacterium]